MIRIVFLYIVVFFFAIVNANAQTISSISYEGNTKTKTSFLEKITEVKVHTVLDSTLLKQDVQRFIRLPGIAHAYFEISESTSNNVTVTYFLEENFTLIPSANIWTTDNDEFAYKIGLYEFNGLGRNLVLGGYFQRDIYNSFGINFRAPFLFSSNFGIAMNYQDLTTLEPVFLDEGTADYKYNNESLEVLGLYQYNFFNRVEAGISFFKEDYQYKEGATNNAVPQSLVVKKQLFKLLYEYNNVTTEYYFQDGFKNTVNFQYVTANDNTLPNFAIGWNDFVFYKKVGDKGNWASRMRLGLSTNNETPFAPFSVDNNLNIRGVGNTIDRGTGAIVLNTEYRYTLFEKKWFVLQGNAFLDGGSWRNPGGNFNDFVASENIRIYPGLGVRFIHKKIFNTVFRIDYGIGISPNATQGFVIGIGQYF
ncbi:MAG: POTRA domain-containing protein [Flavobacteriaceae bacterium]